MIAVDCFVELNAMGSGLVVVDAFGSSVSVVEVADQIGTLKLVDC